MNEHNSLDDGKGVLETTGRNQYRQLGRSLKRKGDFMIHMIVASK